MGVFETSRDVIPLLDQVVVVNGGTNDALWCTQITMGTGPGACTAEFRLPQSLFDSYRGDLSEALVMVYVVNAYDGTAPGTPDFVGNLDVDTATIDPGTDTVRMTANSITAYLSKVWIGQAAKVPTKIFRLIDLVTGRKTNNTPARILQTLFNELPSQYKTRLKLGDTSVLNTTEQTTTPSLTFRNSTFAAALDAILAMFGDVTFTERYDSSGKTYLDFSRIQNPAAPAVSVRIANYDDIIECGANLKSISHTQTTSDSITRVIMYGTARRYVITCSNFDPTPGKVLKKAWDTTLEAAVLANPKSAKPGAPGYKPGMEWVFRRWYLPACFADVTVLKSLGIHRAALPSGEKGPEYHVQVYKYPTTLAFNASTGVHTGTESTTRQLLKNCKVDLDKGYFELDCAEDGLNAMSLETTAKNVQKTVWAPAKVGITFAVEDNKNYVYADTGQDSSSGINLDFASDGLTEQVQRDDLTYIQFTNHGYSIGGYEFDCAFYDEDTHTWHAYTSKTVHTDDTSTLRMLANELLRAKNRRRHTWEGTVFYFARAYRPGCMLYVYGSDNPPPPMMITHVSWNLESQETRISADNVKPPLRKEMKAWHRGDS